MGRGGSSGNAWLIVGRWWWWWWFSSIALLLLFVAMVGVWWCTLGEGNREADEVAHAVAG